MADKQAPAPPRTGDYQPLSDFERRMRQRILSQDLPGVPQEFLQWITGQLELQPPAIIASGLSGLPAAVNDLLPWTIDIDVYMTAIANTNWDTITVDANAVGNATKDSTSVQNNSISWDIMVPAGTWTFELMHTIGANRGIYTVTFGSASWGTIDGYNLGTVRNTRSSLTGLAVAAPTKARLTLTMATKNAGSTAYYGIIQAIQLRRTA